MSYFQGDIVNSIEHHVNQAGEAMETAKVATKKAMIYQEKARMVIIIIIIVGYRYQLQDKKKHSTLFSWTLVFKRDFPVLLNSWHYQKNICFGWVLPVRSAVVFTGTQ